MGSDLAHGTHEIIAALIEVHRFLGPGLLESAYEECLAAESTERGVPFERQHAVPLVYKGRPLDQAYRLDFVVGGNVVVELKAVERILPVHVAQTLTYLKLTGLPVALLVNCNAATLREGLRRLTLKSR